MTFDLQPIHCLQPEQNVQNVIVNYAVVWEYPLLIWWLVFSLFPSVIQLEQAGYNLKLRLIYTTQVFCMSSAYDKLNNDTFCIVQIKPINILSFFFFFHFKYVVGLIYTNITTYKYGRLMVSIIITCDNKLWPLQSSKNCHFQKEARCKTFLVKMSFICMRMKNDFHIKGWAPTLVLKCSEGQGNSEMTY